MDNKTNLTNELPEYMGYFTVESSDVDFISGDIAGLKKRIIKSLDKEDFNAHNKWMNCLRDAIELREKLNGFSDCTLNINTININNDTDLDKFNEIIANTKNNQKGFVQSEYKITGKIEGKGSYVYMCFGSQENVLSTFSKEHGDQYSSIKIERIKNSK